MSDLPIVPFQDFPGLTGFIGDRDTDEEDERRAKVVTAEVDADLGFSRIFGGPRWEDFLAWITAGGEPSYQLVESDPETEPEQPEQPVEPARTPGSTAVADQPAPVDQGRPAAHDLVAADLAERKAFGLAKYGVTLQAGNGRDTLQDVYEELLDAVCYIRTLIEERKGMTQDMTQAKMPNEFLQHDVSDMPRNTIMWVEPEAIEVDAEHRVWIRYDAKVYRRQGPLKDRAAITRHDDGSINIAYAGPHRWQPSSGNLSTLYLLSVTAFSALEEEERA